MAFNADLKESHITEHLIAEYYRSKGKTVVEGNNTNSHDLIVDGTLVEVKTDKITWFTGNYGFEFACRGKRSGISTTQSAAILQVTPYFSGGKCTDVELRLIGTARLRNFLANQKWREIPGGDKEPPKWPRGVSWMYLVPKNQFEKEAALLTWKISTEHLTPPDPKRYPS